VRAFVSKILSSQDLTEYLYDVSLGIRRKIIQLPLAFRREASGEDKINESVVVAFEILAVMVMKSPIFWESVESQLTSGSNMSPPSSGSKIKPSKEAE
jgi:hypothetical protein